MSASIVARLVFWLWFAAAVLAGRTVFLQRLPPAAGPGAAFALTALLAYAYFRFQGVRAWADRLPLRSLVLLHVSRFVGFAFLYYYRRGELPHAFAVPGGIGDIIIATLALPVALAPLEPAARRSATVIWNVAGLIDILLVVATAMRLTLADPAQMFALTRLPLSLLPTFLVPLIIASHLLIFVRLARETQPPPKPEQGS